MVINFLLYVCNLLLYFNVICIILTIKGLITFFYQIVFIFLEIRFNYVINFLRSRETGCSLQNWYPVSGYNRFFTLIHSPFRIILFKILFLREETSTHRCLDSLI